MRRHHTVLAVAVVTGAQQDDGWQSDPAAHGVHHHRACKVMELVARDRLDPGLHAKVLVPGNALKEGVNKAHNHRRGDQLGPKLGPLGDAARNDGGNGRRKGQQKEELDQVVAVLGGQLLGPHKEGGAISHAVTDHKINHSGDRKVHQDLDQGVDLVLFANRAQLQEGKSSVHGQHHDAAQQNK